MVIITHIFNINALRFISIKKDTLIAEFINGTTHSEQLHSSESYCLVKDSETVKVMFFGPEKYFKIHI